MTPDLAGCIYELFSGTSDFTIVSTVETINFIHGGPGASSVINTISVPAVTGTKYVTPIFIGKGGGPSNSRSGGTRSAESGFWIYPAGSAGFIGRISNTSGATNRIVFRFEFCEN